MSFERVIEGELRVGEPAPWSLYDEDKKLLLARGVVLESEKQISQLIERGLFRKLRLYGTPERRVVDERVPEDASSKEAIRSLEDIKLSIGDALQLQGEGPGSRHYVRLIGYLKGRGVIVSTPSVDGKVLLIREGQNYVVRLFSGQSVYAFPATVFKVANVPYPHLHLTYPKEVRGLMVRKGARAAVNLIASVQDVRGHAHAVSLMNLSISGAAFAAKTAVGTKGDRIGIKFRLSINDVEQYLNLQGMLRNVQPETGEDGVTRLVHGVQFVDVPQLEHVSLTAYVYQRLVEEGNG